MAPRLRGRHPKEEEEGGPSKISIERDVEVPMRDGTILRADIYRSSAVVVGPAPVLLLRTPYNKSRSPIVYDHMIKFDELVRAGYIVVLQDVRGRYRSEGKYDSYISSKTHEAEDGYDTVEWAARLPGSSGKVGTFGVSYDAWLQFKLAALRPPSLRAIFALSEPVLYTDLEGPGTIRPGRRIHFYANTMAPDYRRRNALPGSHTTDEAEIEWHKIDRQKWLWFLPWVDLPEYVLGSEGGFFRDWLRHPRSNPFRLDMEHHQIAVPNVMLVGWFDHCNSGIGHHTGLVANGKTELARNNSKLIIGPWNHVGLGDQKCGGVDFGPQAKVDITAILLRWHDHWLKGIQNGVAEEPAVKIFVMGEDRWRSEERWPLDRHHDSTLFMTSKGGANTPLGDGRLTSKAPRAQARDGYTYDPRDPVMSLYSEEFFTQPADQRALAHRRDILVYQTEPLVEELEATGYPKVVLFASSSAPDTDFFARLIDVHPDGEARDLVEGVVRARYRESFEDPLLLEPGKVTEFAIGMGPISNRFKGGHRIRVDITSSDFPSYDRNHNTGRDDSADPVLSVAHQKIYTGGKFPSRLILPQVP